MNKVILLHIDGFRVDTIYAAKLPHINTLMSTGAWTLKAQTVTPSVTLPVHFSIFTSMNSIGHGVLTNGARPNVPRSTMGIIEWAKAHGKSTAMYYNWEFLRELSPPGYLDSSFYINSLMEDDGDMQVAEVAAEDINKKSPDFAFVYLGCPDEVGHERGFESDEYAISLEKADMAIGYLLNSLKENDRQHEYTILLESDHGGVGHEHTTNVPEVMTVPWIINGPLIRTGEISLEQPIKNESIGVVDTIPTLAHCLGIPRHPSWRGRIVTEAFTTEMLLPLSNMKN